MAKGSCTPRMTLTCNCTGVCKCAEHSSHKWGHVSVDSSPLLITLQVHQIILE